jgi:hypothetical protein
MEHVGEEARAKGLDVAVVFFVFIFLFVLFLSGLLVCGIPRVDPKP